MSTRYTWSDVNRAAHRLGDAWRMAGGSTPPNPFPNDSNPIIRDTPANLYVSGGSVSNGVSGSLHWNSQHLDADRWYRVAGSHDLARSARDSYDMVTQRTGALLDIAADRRERHHELAERAAEWIETHQADEDATRTIVAELLAALTEGWNA